jgi:cell division protein FtsX
LLVAVADLLLHSGKHLPERVWGILTCISTVVALLLGVSLLLSWPLKTVTSQEAPRSESDVTPSSAGDVSQDSEGVTLQGPDGVSYGDEHPWGEDDQRKLVEELKGVRQAALLPDRDEG